MAKKLTKSVLDGLRFPKAAVTEAGKPLSQQFTWDSELRGFGVRLTPDGKRSFVVQGRVHGKNVRITIGPYGVFTVDEARDAAREHLRSMRLGIDPRAEAKREEALATTLRQVADAYKRDRQLKDISKTALELHVTRTFKAWLNKPIASITRADVSKRYREMVEGGLHGKKGAPGQANQGFTFLRALFNYAINEYRTPEGDPVFRDNPVDVLRKRMVVLTPRNTFIPKDKVGAVWNMLTTARETEVERLARTSVDLIMFLMLTGARIGEASTLEWERVKLDGPEPHWHIPDPKNRNPVWLPLSTQAVALLNVRKEEARKGERFVFPSPRSGQGCMREPRSRLVKVGKVAGMPIACHDLRRTFTTIGVAYCGIDLYKVEALTNHVAKGVTARHYLETQHLEYLLPEVQKIADWITEQARVAAAVEASENVVALRA